MVPVASAPRAPGGRCPSLADSVRGPDAHARDRPPRQGLMLTMLLLAVEAKAASPWRDLCAWLGILAGAAVFVAALAIPLDDPALVVALGMGLRASRLLL